MRIASAVVTVFAMLAPAANEIGCSKSRVPLLARSPSLCDPPPRRRPPPGVASAMHYSFPLLESLTSTQLDRFQFRR